MPSHQGWRETWRSDPNIVELEGARGAGERRGEVGLARFEAGWSPACSNHGAMNRLSKDQPAVWRCLVAGCNVGTRLVVGSNREDGAPRLHEERRMTASQLPHQAVDEVEVEDGLRWWQCSACGFRMGYHPDDIQPTAASTTYCDRTGGYEPIVPVEEPVV